MAGKPKDPTKEYDPNYGGSGRGAGRKADGRIHRPVAMIFESEEEYRAFMAKTTPRSRVEAVLYAKS